MFKKHVNDANSNPRSNNESFDKGSIKYEVKKVNFNEDIERTSSESTNH